MLNRIRAVRFHGWHEMVLLGLIVALLATAATVKPEFVRWSGQLYSSRQLWDTAILALGMTLVIITGGIDLSVGSTIGLCAVSFGIVHTRTSSIMLSLFTCLGVGLLAGGINGWLIARTRVHPLLVTLATMAGYRGIAEGLSQGTSYSRFGSLFGQLSRGHVAGIPYPGLLFAGMALTYGVWLARSPTGRYLYAIGHNEQAARFSGIPVDTIKFVLYLHNGLLAGLATLVLLARFDTAKADAATGMELEVITAVVVGGTSIFGGRGNLIGTSLGLLLIHEAKLFVSQYWQREELKSILIGLLLVGSVLAYQAVSRQNRRL